MLFNNYKLTNKLVNVSLQYVLLIVSRNLTTCDLNCLVNFNSQTELLLRWTRSL